MSKRESRKRRTRRSKAYRKAMMIMNLIFIAVMVLFVVIGLFHLFTDKKKYRDAGVELYRQGKYQEAVESFDKALECNQWFSDAVNVDIELYKADCYMRADNFTAAHDVYMGILKKYSKRHYDEDGIEFLVSLTTTLDKYSNGDYVSTVANFVEACERGYTEMSVYAAICYENQRNYEKMKEYYDIYTKEFGMNTYMYYKYASYYILNQDYNQALSYIEQGFSAGDQAYIKQLKYTQIMCYQELADYERAFSLAQEYVALYPDDQMGAELYAYLDTRVNVSTEPVNDIYGIGTGSDSDTE